jgi:hypothetical protein
MPLLGACGVIELSPPFLADFSQIMRITSSLMVDGWPTDPPDTAAPTFHAGFKHLLLISWQAQQHDRICINF